MNTVHKEEMKKRRSSKKSLFTRACNRVETLISVNGSREDIEKAALQIDDLVAELEDINEELLETLTNEDERQAAQSYFTEIRESQPETKTKIKDYLMSRGDDSKSVANSRASRSTTVSTASAASRQARRQAEVAARVKRAAVRRLQEQLALEKEPERIEKEQRQLETEQRQHGKETKTEKGRRCGTNI